jgi:hypothetical protein
MDTFDHNLVKPDFLASIRQPSGKSFNTIKGKVIEVNEGRTLVKVLVQGGKHKWIPITQITGPALAWNEKEEKPKEEKPKDHPIMTMAKEAAKEGAKETPAPTPVIKPTLPIPETKPKAEPALRPKETESEIKSNVENLGKGVETNFEKAIAQTADESGLLLAKVDETIVQTPIAEQMNSLEKEADKLSRKLLKDKAGKGKSSKERVLEFMEQGKTNSDIVSAMPEVTTGYVNQLRNDYFSPPPLKEGTLKFNIVKLHKEGKSVEDISAELKTSVAHVKQQIKINEKRKPAA